MSLREDLIKRFTSLRDDEVMVLDKGGMSVIYKDEKRWRGSILVESIEDIDKWLATKKLKEDNAHSL